jgi:pimeloyl-ACP methyl ester carboxylesterase
MMGWLPLLAWAVGNYGLDDVTTTHPNPDITRVEYRISAGPSALNRFSITRVQRNARRPQQSAPVILFSPFLLPGSFYEITETGDYAQSAAGRLAEDGYDVWLVDQRRTGLQPGACEQGTADCSVMADWDFSTLSDDGLLALSIVKTLHPSQKPVVGGFSAGANTALAVVNRAPHAISGVFLYEGSFFTEDASIIAHNAPICQQLEAALEAGQFYDPGAQIYGPILGLAATDPNGLSPIPIFPPGTTNQLALLYVFSTPPPAGALSPTAGFVRCIADFSTQSFVYTNPARLFQTGQKFDVYASLAATRDLACGLAGSDRRHVDHLSAFHGNLLVFVEGTGFGPAMFDTAALFTHAKSVTIDQHPELGEADPYFHVAWQEVFYAPLKQWLDGVAF